jgi:alkylation response protein AidB-like acyl-CoA dehydrogenase
MYRCPTLLVSGFAGIQLGLAREALDELANLAQTKTPWQARQPLREQNRIQDAVARAQAQIESARAYVHATLGDLWDSVAATGRSSADQRARALLAQVHASDNASDVVGTIAQLAGSSALYTPNRFDQCLRDFGPRRTAWCRRRFMNRRVACSWAWRPARRSSSQCCNRGRRPPKLEARSLDP